MSNNRSKFVEMGLRNRVAFWILGLSNNFAYVIMLSAAFDILSSKTKPKTSNEEFDCNDTSTGAVLIADILPCLIIKLIAPFGFYNTNLRVFLVVLLSCSSFIITAFAKQIWVSYFGIVCASLSSGLGETTLLGFTSHFQPEVISWWSSGTGAAGVFGSLIYALLTHIGFSPRNTLLVMIIVPIVMAITFWRLIVKPPVALANVSPLLDESESDDNFNDEIEAINSTGNDNVIYQVDDEPLFMDKIKQIRSILKYMIPLMLVYNFEYFINQGLFELVYFPKTFLTHEEQYRWYQVDYQIGVFISRSSLSLIKINRIYILPILQFANIVVILTQIFYPFMKFLWVMLFLVLFEGFLGGAAYVNTFDRISREVPSKWKEFSLSVTTLSDSIGITLAGFAAIPVHDSICRSLIRH